MNKNDLITVVSEKTSNTKKNTRDVIDSFLDVLSEEIKDGNTVNLPKFGTFKVKLRKERNGYNPSKGVNALIPAKKVATFKAAAKLKKSVEA